MPAAHQGPSERALEPPRAGQQPLLRPEPRGAVVVVHAQEGAGTGAARVGAKSHNIHAFVHPPRGERRPLISSYQIAVARGGNEGGREEKKRSKRPDEEERKREGRVHIFITDCCEGEGGEEGGAGPGDLSAGLVSRAALPVVFPFFLARPEV